MAVISRNFQPNNFVDPAIKKGGILSAWNALPQEQRTALLMGLSRGLTEIAAPSPYKRSLAEGFGRGASYGAQGIEQSKLRAEQKASQKRQDQLIDNQETRAQEAHDLKINQYEADKQALESNKAYAKSIIDDPNSSPRHKTLANLYIRNPNEKLFNELTKDNRTALQKNVDYYGREGYQKLKSKNEVNVDVNTANNEFNERFGKNNADSFFEEQANAKDARQSLLSSIEARKLLDSGVITGFGGDFKLGLGKALQAAGFNQFDDPIANTEAYFGSRAQEVGRIIKLFGAGTGLSDADREFASKAAAGQITLSEESIRRLLDINDKVARNVLSAYNEKASAIDPSLSPYPLTIEVPEYQGDDLEARLRKYGL